MRTGNRLLEALAIVVLVAAIGGALGALIIYAPADGSAYPGLAAPVAVVCPGPAGVGDEGGPGVRPRDDCTPSFTQLEVRDYLQSVVIPGGYLDMNVRVMGRARVTRVVFLTIADLGRLTGDSEWAANYPVDLVVCYAQLSGAFMVYGPPHFIPQRASAAFVVFDGHTGNELTLGNGALLG
jgi:hypothetical protein